MTTFFSRLFSVQLKIMYCVYLLFVFLVFFVLPLVLFRFYFVSIRQDFQVRNVDYNKWTRKRTKTHILCVLYSIFNVSPYNNNLKLRRNIREREKTNKETREEKKSERSKFLIKPNQYYQMSNSLKIANIDRIACWFSSRWFQFDILFIFVHFSPGWQRKK